ncbi:MAG TPA: class I SAM-dependent methyltransferase [Planctomycetes bacterium]|nr:class I SAM-dependent methyltransferase [Planctomycetota bacterium]
MSLDRILEPEYMDDPEEAEEYDAMDHTEPNRAFVNRLIELGARGRLIDLGCGPGHITVLAAESLPHADVLGVDAARSMLRIAKARRAASPARDRVRFLQGRVQELGLSDGSFDGVFSNTVLHHIPKPVPFLAEAGRLLAKGGVLLIRDLVRPETEDQLTALVALHAKDANARQRELFRASLHAALTPEELAQAAKEAGLRDFEITRDSDRHMSLQIAARR